MVIEPDSPDITSPSWRRDGHNNHRHLLHCAGGWFSNAVKVGRGRFSRPLGSQLCLTRPMGGQPRADICQPSARTRWRMPGHASAHRYTCQLQTDSNSRSPTIPISDWAAECVNHLHDEYALSKDRLQPCSRQREAEHQWQQCLGL